MSFEQKRLVRQTGVIVSVAVAAAIGTAAAMTLAGNRVAAHALPQAEAVKAALVTRLPKTRVSSVDCAKLGGLCEVAAGTTLFYTDASARYLIIGRVYDMQTRTDLTAARLLELNPDLLVGGAAHTDQARGPQDRQAPAAARRKVDLSSLPASGAIRWGPENGPRLIVFSDFRCSYCAHLSVILREIGARVEERPISTLGSRALSEAVYCAADPVAALHAAYDGASTKSGSNAHRSCDTSGLDANEAFARAHGFNGTPVIVRADGAVIEGFRSAPVLAAWLKSGAGA